MVSALRKASNIGGEDKKPDLMSSWAGWSKVSLRMTRDKISSVNRMLWAEYDNRMEEIHCDVIVLKLSLPPGSDFGEAMIAAASAGTRYPAEVAYFSATTGTVEDKTTKGRTSSGVPESHFEYSHGEVSAVLDFDAGQVKFTAPPGMMSSMNPLYDAFAKTLNQVEWDARNGGTLTCLDSRGVIENIDLGFTPQSKS